MMYNIYAAAIRGGPIFCTVIVADTPIAGGPTTTSADGGAGHGPQHREVYAPVIRPGGRW